MMRPKAAFDPFSSSSASSREEALSGAWKAPKEDPFASGAYSTHSSPPRAHKPYRRFHENDDVPFDQQAAVVVQDSAPSFDEGTEEETSGEDRAAARQLTSFDEQRPPTTAVPNVPTLSYSNNSETTDDSGLGSKSLRQQRQQQPEPRSARRNVDHPSPSREAPPSARTPPRQSLHDRYSRGILDVNQHHHEQEQLPVINHPTEHQIPSGLWNVDPEEEWRETEESEMDYHTQSFEDYGITNPHANKVAAAPANLEYDSFDHIEDMSSKVSSLTPATAVDKKVLQQPQPRSILKRRTVASDAEDSALVTSDEDVQVRKKKETTKNKSSKKQSSKQRRGRKQPPPKESEDDTSLEVYGVARRRPSSVKHRTQEAFGKRGKQREKSPSYNNGRGVSFEKRHRVHRYEQEEDSETQMTGWTGTSSVNSTYSKSMESEVEDLVKDLFFIGEATATQPGRRKRSGTKRQPQQVHPYEDTTVGSSTLDTNEEDATLNTLDDDLNYGDESTNEQSTIESTVTSTPGDTITKSTLTTEATDDDPLLSMWSMMQGGFSAVGAVLGISSIPEENPPPTKPSSSATAKQPMSSRGIQNDQINETPMSSMEGANDLDNSHSSTLADMIHIASDYILSSSGSHCNASPVNLASDDRSCKSLEDDGRLAELALYAARSKHEIHGIVFDESSEVDIVSEVKFSVVKVLLPMGILFQENDGGCWATKVFASGNAALRAKGGTVEVGDQLAAINGTSAIEMKVDRICSMVSEVPKGHEVELTFLRYTGPMRPSPGTIKEEGYEVRDPGMERQKRPGGLLSKKSGWMSSRKKNQIKIEAPSYEQPPPPPPKDKKRFRLFGRKKSY